MSLKTCKVRLGGCGYPFKTEERHPHASICGECKEKKYKGRGFVNIHVNNR